MPSPTSLSSVRQDAIARRDRGDLNSARTLLERALEAATMTSGEDHPEVLATAHLLASLHRQAGDLSAARRVLENALYAGTNRHGEEHPLMLSISFELAEIADELGNRHEARRHYTRVAKYGPGAVNFNQQQVQAARAWLGPSAPAPANVQGRPVILPAPEPLQASMPQTPAARPAQEDDFGLGPATSPPRFGPAAKQPPPQPTMPTQQTVPTQPTMPTQQTMPTQPTLPPRTAPPQQPVPSQQTMPTQPLPPQPPAPQTQPVPTQPVPPPPQQPPARPVPPPAPEDVPTVSLLPTQPPRPAQQAPQSSGPTPAWPQPQGRQAPSQSVTQQGLPTPRPPQLNPPTTTAYPSSPVAIGPQSGIPAGPPPKRGRGMLIGSLIAAVVVVLAATAGVYFFLNNTKGNGTGSDLLPATNVAIVVRDDRVTLTWNDPSNGVAQPIIVGFRESEGLRRFAMPAPGSTEAVIPGLNKNYDYCFGVVLVYPGDKIAESEQVCTERKKPSPSPSR